MDGGDGVRGADAPTRERTLDACTALGTELDEVEAFRKLGDALTSMRNAAGANIGMGLHFTDVLKTAPDAIINTAFLHALGEDRPHIGLKTELMHYLNITSFGKPAKTIGVKMRTKTGGDLKPKYEVKVGPEPEFHKAFNLDVKIFDKIKGLAPYGKGPGALGGRHAGAAERASTG